MTTTTTTTTQLIVEKLPNIKQQEEACFEIKVRSVKKSLAFLFEEINALKRQLKPEKTASSKKSIKEG
jgi:hypothetical protein